MSKLLINEYPMMFQMSLAVQIGLNEAIFLQQLHYWIKHSNNKKDDSVWVYNSYEKWQEQFPCWSINTIRRIISQLEKMNLIISNSFNKMRMDKTKWYTINYEELDKYSDDIEVPSPLKTPESTDVIKMGRPSAQNEQIMCPKRANQVIKMSKAIPETTTETTTYKKYIYSPNDDKQTDYSSEAYFNEIYKEYPNKVKRKGAYRYYRMSVKTQQDYDDIKRALSNYLSSRRVSNGFVMNADTWFNNWGDWLSYKEKTEQEVVEDNNRQFIEEMKKKFGGD